MPAPVYQKSFVLTVSSSKRLIAVALRRHPAVIAALNKGTVAIAKGTTNAYVAEEFLGRGIHKPDYCTGVTLPPRGDGEPRTTGRFPDVVLRNGQEVPGVSVQETACEMGPGDIFVKGANALNYERRQAAILVGHPEGGTIGATIGKLIARRVTLLIPIGLEKSVPGDLHELCREMAATGVNGSGPMLWPLDGTIFTEVEALQLYMAGGRVAAIAAGGVGGAEGSVRISVWGSPDNVARAEGIIESVGSEGPFL
jgi:hypothetical protein